MKLVSQLLTAKGHDVWSIAPDTTVLNALQLMADREDVIEQLEQYITGTF